MGLTIDFTSQSKANARTTLLKARDDPSTIEITLIHAPAEKLPDMMPFQLQTSDQTGRRVIATYRRP